MRYICVCIVLIRFCLCSNASEYVVTFFNVDSGKCDKGNTKGHVMGADDEGERVFLVAFDGVLSEYGFGEDPPTLKSLGRISIERGGAFSPDFTKIASVAYANPPDTNKSAWGIWLAETLRRDKSTFLLKLEDADLYGAFVGWLTEDKLIFKAAGGTFPSQYGNCVLRIDTILGRVDFLHRGTKLFSMAHALSCDRRRFAFFDDIPSQEKSVLKILDIESGEVTALDVDFRATWCTCLAWSPDGKRLAFSGPGFIRIVNVNDRSILEMRGGSYFHPVFFPTNDRVVGFQGSAGGAEHLYTYDAHTGKRLHKRRVLDFGGAAVLPNHRMLVYGTNVIEDDWDPKEGRWIPKH